VGRPVEAIAVGNTPAPRTKCVTRNFARRSMRLRSAGYAGWCRVGSGAALPLLISSFDKRPVFLREKDENRLVSDLFNWPYPLPLPTCKSAMSNLGYQQGDFPISPKSRRLLPQPAIFPDLPTPKSNSVATVVKEFFAKG